jgi:RNA polymerase-binding transcription factor DksA
MSTTTPRTLLESERTRLQSILDSLRQETANVTSDGGTFSEGAVDQHPADMGTETFELEKDLSIQNNVEAELADITWALKRVDEGTYGVCEACGRKIVKARLEVMPAARFCVKDQQRAERARRAA